LHVRSPRPLQAGVEVQSVARGDEYALAQQQPGADALHLDAVAARNQHRFIDRTAGGAVRSQVAGTLQRDQAAIHFGNILLWPVQTAVVQSQVAANFKHIGRHRGAWEVGQLQTDVYQIQSAILDLDQPLLAERLFAVPCQRQRRGVLARRVGVQDEGTPFQMERRDPMFARAGQEQHDARRQQFLLLQIA